MSASDYAIVVGISDYPLLGADATLKAADKDAAAIRAWLVKEGSVLDKNIFEFRTEGSDQPQAASIRLAFRRLRAIAEEKSRAGMGMKVGRRLYLYLSGHGFSPGHGRGALYSADATTYDPLHTYATGWLEWFQDHGYFDEYVLWLDCCMDRELMVTLEALFLGGGTFSASGPAFVAFAAKRPLKTVERPIAEDNGKLHGIFTWTLLKGLRGGAADPTGAVTSESLRLYLENGLSQYLSADDTNDPDISKRPDVVRSDPGIVFAVHAGVSKTTVTINFPQECEGAVARVWNGFPPRPQDARIHDRKVTLELGKGLYLVDAIQHGYRQGFEVVSPDRLEISVEKKGSSITSPPDSASYFISVDPMNPAAEITVLDHQLTTAETGRGFFSHSFPFGLFKIQVQVGRDLQEIVVILDRDVELNNLRVFDDVVLRDRNGSVEFHEPRLATAIPLLGNAFTHEYHVAAAQVWTAAPRIRPIAQFGASYKPATAEIRIMARVWSGRNSLHAQMLPWTEMSIVDARGRSLSTADQWSTESRAADALAKGILEVMPGAYFLKHPTSNNATLEQSLFVPSGWILEVHLLFLRSRENSAEERYSLPRISMVMRPRLTAPGHPEAPDAAHDDGAFEAGRVALADERPILNARLEGLLLHKFTNPMAGIIGAHLLILECERKAGDPRLEWLNEVVPNLRMLVGVDHPDVEAISLRCPQESLRTVEPLRHLPIFERSWRLLVDTSFANPALVPAALSLRAHAATPIGGFLVWACDNATRQAHRRQVRRWVTDLGSGEAPGLSTAMQSAGLAGLPVLEHLRGRGGLASVNLGSAHAPLSRELSPVVARELRLPLSTLETLLAEDGS